MRKRVNGAAGVVKPGQRYAGTKELMAYTGLGRDSATRIGKESGAFIKIGGRTLFDLRKVDEYMSAQSLIHAKGVPAAGVTE